MCAKTEDAIHRAPSISHCAYLFNIATMNGSEGVVPLLLRQELLDSFIADRECDLTVNRSRKRLLLSLIAKTVRQPDQRYQEYRRTGVWEEHLTKCLYKKLEFQMRYHMSKRAFDMLVAHLDLGQLLFSS